MFILKNSLKISLIFIISVFLIFPIHIFNGMVLKKPVTAWAEEPDPPPVIDFMPVTRAEAGEPIEIIVNIESENTVMSPRVYYRRKGESNYHMIRMQRDRDRYTAVIPRSAVTGDGVEYYITASDMYDNYVSEGDAQKPLFAAVIGEADEDPPVINFTPVRKIDKGKDLLLKANVEDKSEIKDFRVYYRQKNRPSYNILQMEMTSESDGYYQAVIPSDEIDEKDLEYYFEAKDIFENMTTDGTEDYPHIAKSIKDPPNKGDSIFKKWWFWAIVAGAGVGAGIAGGSGGGGDSPSGSPTMATVTIE